MQGRSRTVPLRRLGWLNVDLDWQSLIVIPYEESTFSLRLRSNLDRKSAAMFTRPGTCAIVTLNCRTKSHAVQMTFVWKFLFTDLLFCQEDDRFGRSTQNVARLHEWKVYCLEIFGIYRHFDLRWREGFGWVVCLLDWRQFLIGVFLNHKGIAGIP